jgi:hypothetical protein
MEKYYRLANVSGGFAKLCESLSLSLSLSLSFRFWFLVWFGLVSASVVLKSQVHAPPHPVYKAFL